MRCRCAAQPLVGGDKTKDCMSLPSHHGCGQKGQQTMCWPQTTYLPEMIAWDGCLLCSLALSCIFPWQLNLVVSGPAWPHAANPHSPPAPQLYNGKAPFDFPTHSNAPTHTIHHCLQKGPAHAFSRIKRRLCIHCLFQKLNDFT